MGPRGDIPKEQFLAERSRLLAEIERVWADASLPTEVADLPAQLGQLVTYWDSLDPAERGRVLETIFDSLELDSRRIVAATPRAGWVDYFERVFLERKTGLFRTEAADFVLPILVRSSSDESPYPEPLAIVRAGPGDAQELGI